MRVTPHLEPQEHAGLGARPGREARAVLVQRGVERGGIGGVAALEAADVRIKAHIAPALEQAVHHELARARGAEGSRVDGGEAGPEERRRGGQPAEAETRREELRRGLDAHDAAVRVVVQQPRRERAACTQAQVQRVELPALLRSRPEGKEGRGMQRPARSSA